MIVKVFALKRCKPTWYHLQRVVAGDELQTAYVCPQGRGTSLIPCVHERYVRECHITPADEDGTSLQLQPGPD